MNDAGLSLAINEITASKDGSKSPNLNGMPMMFLFRKILEECTTVDEAEKMLKAHARTTWFCLTVCDTKGGCVFEVTPRNVVRRTGVNDVCCCTNHFRTDELCVTDEVRPVSEARSGAEGGRQARRGRGGQGPRLGEPGAGARSSAWSSSRRTAIAAPRLRRRRQECHGRSR